MASQHEDPDNNNSNNNNIDGMIITFMEITSATQEEAQFYLEIHNFDVDAAVSSFFESNSAAASLPPPSSAAAVAAGDGDAEFLSPQPSPSPSSPSASLSPSPSPSRSRSHSPPSGVRSQYSLRSRRNASNKSGGGGDNNGGRSLSSRNRGRAGGVRTLADLNRKSGADGSDSDSDGEPPQFFTGGAKSGMVVQDASNDIDAEAIFERARRMGGIDGPVDVHQPSSSSRSFTGTARLLSGEMVPSSPHEQVPEAVTHTITLWRNGFTVDDGPLRRFDDAENAPFLESVTNSECPKELMPANAKTAVHVDLVRRNENCPEPKKKRSAFQGVGRTLGSSSPTSSEPSAAVNSTPSPAVNSAPSPVMGLVVDDKLPSTSIQLRLSDGTRMVSRFNYHHTIRDIHAFINASRPARTGAYTLQMMGFPPKQLTDLDQTIEQAGLANSVIIQKF